MTKSLTLAHALSPKLPKPDVPQPAHPLKCFIEAFPERACMYVLNALSLSNKNLLLRLRDVEFGRNSRKVSMSSRNNPGRRNTSHCFVLHAATIAVLQYTDGFPRWRGRFPVEFQTGRTELMLPKTFFPDILLTYSANCVRVDFRSGALSKTRCSYLLCSQLTFYLLHMCKETAAHGVAYYCSLHQ